MDMAELLQPLGDLVLQAQTFRQAIDRSDFGGYSAIPCQPGGHAVIGELGPIADTRPIDVRCLQGAIGVDHHFDNNGQPIFGQIQGSAIGGKPFGQHWEDHGRCIDRSCIMACMVVNGRAVFHQHVHVRHSHANLCLVVG